MKVADSPDLRGEVYADIEASEELGGDPELGQVRPVEVDSSRGGVPLLAEVVDDADLVAALDQLACDLAANEPGAAGDNYALAQTTIS